MTNWRRILLGIGGLGLCWCALNIAMSCEQSRGTKHEIIAAEQKGRADEHAKAAAVEVAQAKAASVQDASAKAEVERLKGELAAIKRRVAAPRPTDPTAVVPEPNQGASSPVVVDLAHIVAKQEEVIAAQDTRITTLEARATHWEKAAGEYQAAFRHERDRALSLELALEAQKAISRGSLWKGRIQGVAIGFAAGYASGRLR